jgi:hypothetical protein
MQLTVFAGRQRVAAVQRNASEAASQPAGERTERIDWSDILV